MKKTNIPEDNEAWSLIESTTMLIQKFRENFVKQSTSKNEGHVEVSKESENFVVTMKLERKKK